MNIKKILLLVFIILTYFQNSYSENSISIVYKINNKIITSLDIKKEEQYLLALNNQLQNLDKRKRFNLAKESALREKIKEIELEKYYVFNQENPLLDKIIESFYTKLKLNNENEFMKYLQAFNLTIPELKKKIEIERSWNDLIYKIYNNQVNIDENKLKSKIKNKKNKTTLLLLSEIIFTKDQGQSVDQKIKNIYESIKEIGFKNTANIYSISDSAKFGGDIGWVDKQKLSKKILEFVEKTQVNNYTKPIPISNGYMILKLEEQKDQIIKVDINKELEEMIRFETDNQLNKFSKIYFDKIKINTIINEL
jgi:peptidyl-prolyl cis-trans isomerase SurA